MAPPKGNSTSCVQQIVDCLCGGSLSPRALPAQSLSADVYVKPTHRPPPLPIMAAVFSRKVERVRMVLAQKPESVNAIDEEGNRPVTWAASLGCTDIVELLCAAGADVTCVDEDNQTPLHVACYKGHTGAVQVLLANKACVNAVTKRGLTALHVAASRDFGPIVALLLFAGANPSAVDLEGHTPLHSSARSGCIDAARMLIAAGSPLDAADGRGLTPLHAAYESHHDEVATVLEEAGAHADLRDLAGRTPCESAVALEVEARAVARVGFDTLRLPAVNTGRLKTPPPIPRAKVEEAGPVIVAPPPVAIKPNPFRAQAEKAKG